ncbi:MAG TPA: hypothetical protein PK629_06425 [Oscillospiraceae bacterium]|nr:hypothetical protein [Oscillospiraceae bacterium]HPF55262.1 hypothetical protein [Clostridiales bacterium]HPK36012.1 hypothetical protein [Oscillospiraceae bacterium]
MDYKKYTFQKAVPVWETGKETEVNHWLEFRCEAKKSESVLLMLSGSTAYIVKVNGKFVTFGPARCAHGFYRVDELELAPLCDRENNIVTVTVFGYNCTSYYHICQPSFLCAELICGGKVTAYTGGDDFIAREVTEHEQKTERYSFQRPFTEVYNLDSSYRDFSTKADISAFTPVPLSRTEDKNFIPRGSYLNRYSHVGAKEVCLRGKFTVGDHSKDIAYRRHITGISDNLTGFQLNELTTNSLLTAKNIDSYDMVKVSEAPETVKIKQNEFAVYAMKHNTTGQIEFTVTCENDAEVLVTYSELLEKTGEPVDFSHADLVSVLIWRLKKGTYRLSSAEPYTAMYLKIAAIGANITVSDFGMNYFGADEPKKIYNGTDPQLQAIFDAAVETYRQNTFTIFMDCPSRERAGWLCDSFFTSRVERLMTGKSEVEHAFLENFLLPEHFENLPDGMLPMCYPGDHRDGNFIPNWAMWFVLELEEYLARTGDRAFIDAAKSRIYALLNYFTPFENEYGLLEKLEKWVFVEWSKSNELVQDVNFPTNMLYARMLESVAHLYGDQAAAEKAAKIKETVNKLSFDGQFYCDNMVRGKAGKLYPTGNRTESCQYYAFFCGTASRETRPELWNILLNDFGPQRIKERNWPNFRDDAKWKEIYPANTFIGNYLRLELLCRYGEYEKLTENIKGFFTKMADTTGTLWENETPNASCNHGFASHVLYWMDKLDMISNK